MKKSKILIGAGGTGTSFAIVSQLRSTWPNLEIFVTDSNPKELVTSSLFSDQFIQVPPVTDVLFESAIREIIREKDISVYQPILNAEIALAFKLSLENEFTHVKFLINGYSENFTDKKILGRWLNSHLFSTPKNYELGQIADIDGNFLIKPRDGSGSKGVEILSGSQIRELSKDTLAQVLIEEVCEGPEITVDSFHDFQSGTQFTYCRERLEVKSGVCVKARIFFDEGIHALAMRLARELGQNGTICFQLMQASGQTVITDLNFRSGAGTAMTVAAGFDVLSANFAVNTNHDYSRFVEPIGKNFNTIVTRQYSEFVMSQSVASL
ncbi:MAG: hypothetical protein RL228_345 [Actinomycetota bacterium]